MVGGVGPGGRHNCRPSVCPGSLDPCFEPRRRRPGEPKPRLLALSAAGLVALLVGCALYTKTDYAEYRGPTEFQGQGGTVRSVGGIDVWQTGTPNRKFKVLGVIQQSHYANHSLISVIAGATKDSEIIKEAKAHGGDAVIVLGSSSTITGFTTHARAQGSESGTFTGSGGAGGFSGTYSGASSSDTTANTVANTRTDKVIAVIKYLN